MKQVDRHPCRTVVRASRPPRQARLFCSRELLRRQLTAHLYAPDENGIAHRPRVVVDGPKRDRLAPDGQPYGAGNAPAGLTGDAARHDLGQRADGDGGDGAYDGGRHSRTRYDGQMLLTLEWQLLIAQGHAAALAKVVILIANSCAATADDRWHTFHVLHSAAIIAADWCGNNALHRLITG